MSPTPAGRVALGGDGYTISPLLNGCWQLARGHRPGAPDERALFADLDRLVAAGRTTFDCADIYTGVEELLGRWLRRAPAPVEVHTKLVPDLEALPRLRRADVERIVDRSLARLGVERLDLVQLHWWDYGVPGHVEAALWLSELRRRGKLRHVGLTNFDVPRTREILDAGVPVVSAQVQVSLLDRRAESGLAALARERGFALLAYGTLAGGFLSERWRGVRAGDVELSNRSLVKYELVVRELGGWGVLQELLERLARVAARHGVPLAAVALRWALDRPAVAGAVVGTYHGRHLEADRAALSLELDERDREELAELLDRHPGPAGDCFVLERVQGGPHERILRKDLNREP